MSFDLAEHPHRRLNLLTGQWVLVSPHRAKRPWQGETAPLEAHREVDHEPGCYLCPGNVRVTENARTLDAADPLRSGDLAILGRLMAESHASMRDDFGITVEPTDRLSAPLAEAIGERGGARQTGGGFGGAVVAVMPVEIVERVRKAVPTGYRPPDGDLPLIMIEQASAGAGLLTEAR